MTTPEIKSQEPTDQNVPQEQLKPSETEPVDVSGEIVPTSVPVATQVQDATQQQQPVSDDTTQNPVITITVPATSQQLEDWVKGTPENSLTWVAFYWIRMIKKAILHGWGVITQPQLPPPTNA